MKIVGFEGNGGLRLGVVEGGEVIDLQAVDARLPANLGDVLAQNNGDLRLPRRSGEARAGHGAPPARRAQIRAAGGAAGQDHLPRAELSRSRPGRAAARQHPALSQHLPALPDLADAARGPDRAAAGIGAARLRVRAGRCRGRPGAQPDARQCDLVHRRLFLLQRRLGARIPAPHLAVEHGQEFRPHRRLRTLDGDGGRAAERRRRPEHPDPAQRPGHAVGQYQEHDVPAGRDAGLSHQGHDARAGRHHRHRHALGRRPRPQAAGVDEGRRHRRGRHRKGRRVAQPDRGRDSSARRTPVSPSPLWGEPGWGVAACR